MRRIAINVGLSFTDTITVEFQIAFDGALCHYVIGRIQPEMHIMTSCGLHAMVLLPPVG